MTAPTMIQTADGQEMNVADAVCEGCSQPLADHSCGGSGGTGGGSVTYSRSTGPRKPASAHPTCPHCGGRVHFNMSGTAINAECLTRQFSLDTGLMTDPNGRLPVLTLEMMEEISEWSKSLSTPPTYGKMVSAAGGAGTYSGLRPKTGRKKKIAPAAPGSQIQDMADDVVVDAEKTPAKSKKSRGKKGTPKSVPNPAMDEMANGEMGTMLTPGSFQDIELAILVPPAEQTQADEEQAAAVPDNNEEAARAARAARRAERKKLLAGKV